MRGKTRREMLIWLLFAFASCRPAALAFGLLPKSPSASSSERPPAIILLMNITLNGQPFDLPDRSTVASLIKLRQQSGHLKTNAYAVELNRQVCLRPQHESTPLTPGDKVEVVVMVGGG